MPDWLMNRWTAVVAGAVVLSLIGFLVLNRPDYSSTALLTDSPEAQAGLSTVKAAVEVFRKSKALPGDVFAEGTTDLAKGQIASALEGVTEASSVKSAEWTNEYLKLVIAAKGADGSARELGMIFLKDSKGRLLLRGSFAGGPAPKTKK